MPHRLPRRQLPAGIGAATLPWDVAPAQPAAGGTLRA
ncbi:MAG: hypothetical protein JWP04_1121 [Belnapia sp.]|nr:hypothetical protein [Belnapia sp.]